MFRDAIIALAEQKRLPYQFDVDTYPEFVVVKYENFNTITRVDTNEKYDCNYKNVYVLFNNVGKLYAAFPEQAHPNLIKQQSLFPHMVLYALTDKPTLFDGMLGDSDRPSFCLGDGSYANYSSLITSYRKDIDAKFVSKVLLYLNYVRAYLATQSSGTPHFSVDRILSHVSSSVNLLSINDVERMIKERVDLEYRRALDDNPIKFCLVETDKKSTVFISFIDRIMRFPKTVNKGKTKNGTVLYTDNLVSNSGSLSILEYLRTNPILKFNGENIMYTPLIPDIENSLVFEEDITHILSAEINKRTKIKVLTNPNKIELTFEQLHYAVQ